MVCHSIEFRQNLLDAGIMCVVRQWFAVVRGKHHHCGVRGKLADLACGLKPVHHRHLQIQNHHVGMQFLDLFNRYLAVLCLATYFPIAVFLDAQA